jgi:hypothetical protein
MLRRRAHGVCYAKRSMAMQCHRLSLKSLGRRWYLSTFTSDEVPGSCPSLSRPGRCPRPRLPLRWEGAVRMVETHSAAASPSSPRSSSAQPGDAFVGVEGEDIRTLRAKRPEASAVCRKAAGSRPHPVPGSHTQLHAIPMESTCNPRMWPRAVHVRGSTWTPWRSMSKGVAKGRVERAGGPPCFRSRATQGSAGHGLAGGSGQPSASR